MKRSGKKYIFVITGIVMLLVICLFGNRKTEHTDDEKLKTEVRNEAGTENEITQEEDVENQVLEKHEGTTEAEKEKHDLKQEEPLIDYSIKFPAEIRNSGICVQAITSYDGVFIENGEDKEVRNVTIMLLTNNSENDIEYAEITVNRDDKPLQFNASLIPKNATIVMQEMNQTPYVEGTYENLQIKTANEISMNLAEKEVEIVDNSDNSLTITNISNTDIASLRIFYKFFMEEENVYIGGIAYTAKIDNLSVGESCKIVPSHYVSGVSKIMQVRVYGE